jgi:hypothetical protein
LPHGSCDLSDQAVYLIIDHHFDYRDCRDLSDRHSVSLHPSLSDRHDVPDLFDPFDRRDDHELPELSELPDRCDIIDLCALNLDKQSFQKYYV